MERLGREVRGDASARRSRATCRSGGGRAGGAVTGPSIGFRNESCPGEAGFLEAEDEHEGFIKGAQFGRVEASGRSTEALGVDDGGLLDKHTRLLPIERNGRADAGRPGACRGGRDEDGAEVEELVGLDDHGVAGAALFVPAGCARGRQPEDLGRQLE